MLLIFFGLIIFLLKGNYEGDLYHRFICRKGVICESLITNTWTPFTHLDVALV